MNALRLGANDNRPADVRFLQTFLRDYEKADVAITGIFDAKTFKAVENFQTKYRTDILSPWGASLPSGYVYITTKKKINEIYCGKPISLTSAEHVTINAFKARRAAANAAGTDIPDIDLSEIGVNPSPTATGLANTVNTMPTTSVANATSTGGSRFIDATASAIRSVPRSVYNFFHKLFKGGDKE